MTVFEDLKDMAKNAFLSDFLAAFIGITYFLGWMAGIALAKGFWSTFFAIITGGFYSWYLIVERFLIHINWL